MQACVSRFRFPAFNVHILAMDCQIGLSWEKSMREACCGGQTCIEHQQRRRPQNQSMTCVSIHVADTVWLECGLRSAADLFLQIKAWKVTEHGIGS